MKNLRYKLHKLWQIVFQIRLQLLIPILLLKKKILKKLKATTMKATVLIKAKMIKFLNKRVNQLLCRSHSMIIILEIVQFLTKSVLYNHYLHSYQQQILHIKSKFFPQNNLLIKINLLTWHCKTLYLTPKTEFHHCKKKNRDKKEYWKWNKKKAMKI